MVGNMHKNVSAILFAAFIAVVLCGCGQSQRSQQMATMSEMKQICLAKLQAESAGQVPSLADISNSLSIDGSKYETTEAWSNPEAAEDAIILREKTATGGPRVVALANGSVIIQ
jgi:hypothetical protein